MNVCKQRRAKPLHLRWSCCFTSSEPLWRGKDISLSICSLFAKESAKCHPDVNQRDFQTVFYFSIASLLAGNNISHSFHLTGVEIMWWGKWSVNHKGNASSPWRNKEVKIRENRKRIDLFLQNAAKWFISISVKRFECHPTVVSLNMSGLICIHLVYGFCRNVFILLCFSNSKKMKTGLQSISFKTLSIGLSLVSAILGESVPRGAD